MRLILLFLLLPFVGIAQNDTTKYYKSLDYGWNYQRLKARAAMVLPSDTIANKLGIVTIDTFLFVGNGVRWAKVGGAGGGGTADSTIFYTKYRSDTSRSNIYSAIGNKLNTSDSTIYYTKYRSDTSRSNIYTNINTKLNKSDSTIYETKYRSDTARTNTYTALVPYTGATQNLNLGLKNIIVNNVDARTTTIVSSNQTIQLNNDSSFIQLATGTTANIFYNLPNATSLLVGASFQFNNNTTSGYVSVRNFGIVNTISTIPAGGAVQVVLLSNTTTTGTWDVLNYGPKNTSWGTDTLIATSTTAKFSKLILGNPLTVANGGADSTTYQTKFRSDSARTNTYTAINTKVNSSDSTLYQTKFRSDSARTNIYTAIADKIGTGDTSVFQRKSLDAYSFQANNTPSIANATANYFRDSASKTLSSGITWNGTPPSGTQTHQYRWNRIGNLVTLYITLVYSTAGANNTQVTIALPSDLPDPFRPTGLTAANEMLYSGTAIVTTSNTTIITTARTCMIRRNTANTGFDVIATAPTAAQKLVIINIQYFTN